MKPQFVSRAARAAGVAVLAVAMLGACATEPKVRTGPGDSGTAAPVTAAPAPPTTAPITGGPAVDPGPVPAPAPPGGTDATTVEPYMVKGRITDSQGNPLPGVEVYADNTLLYNSNALGVSDANGYYRIPLGMDFATWRMGGNHEVEWEGDFYQFQLDVDRRAFSSEEGAIRDFTWLLTGVIDRSIDLHHGADVSVYEEIGEYNIEDLTWVQVTFVPEGPLIDGSEGETLTYMADYTWLSGVPVGRYTVSAEVQPPGQAPQPLLIRVRNEGEYAPSVSMGFQPASVWGAEQYLEVKVP